MGSSTFRQALGVGLVVWVLSALGVWSALHHEAAEDPEELRANVRIATEEAFSALAEAAEELGIPESEATELQEELDEEELDEEDEDGEPRFEIGEWSGERILELLLESDWLREDLAEKSICWHLVDRHGRWKIGNVSFTAPVDDDADQHDGPFMRVQGAEVDPGDEVQALDEWNEPADEQRMECLMLELELADGARLRTGRELEPAELGAPLVASLVLLLLGLAVAIGGSWLLARRTVRFVADLRSARARLEGDAFPRLRRPGDGGDFDHAASEINGILDRLDSALRSLTHVTDNIAHDLRTPLTRLQGQLDVVRRSGWPSEEMLVAVQEEADQLVATFNALLRIAQVESGSRRRGFRPFDLAQVVADVGELYAPAFVDAELTFELRNSGSPLRLQGDPDLWMQALSNLLDNALKYTPPGGRAQLDLSPGPPPRIVLRDTGPGIPEDEHAKVFERFYRSERRRRPETRGAGLGLSLVAAICELHRADIRLENDGGLVVRIVLRR